MPYRKLSSGEESRAYLWMALLSPLTGWPDLYDYFRFKAKFGGSCWYDLHLATIPRYLTDRFQEDGWEIRVRTHEPRANGGIFHLSYTGGSNRAGILSASYENSDPTELRWSEIKDANKSPQPTTGSSAARRG